MSDRETIMIDNEVLKHFALQAKCRFPMHQVYVENDIPLPALPYRYEVEKSDKITHYLRTTFTGDYGPQSNETYQKSCCWGTHRNGYSAFMESYNLQRHALDEKVINGILEATKAQSISIGMLYAERRETVLAITNVVERCIAGYRAIRHPYRLYQAVTGKAPSRSMKRRLKKSAARVTRKCSTVADAWLEYRYVWTPLVRDVWDAMDALRKQKQKMYRYEQSYGEFFETKYTDNVSVWNTKPDATATLEGYYGSHIRYYYDVENPLATAWSSLTDTAAFLWDLAPWSFVWDWFMDLSTYLDLRSATWGLSFTDGYMAQLRVCQTSFTGVDYVERAWWNPMYSYRYESYPDLPNHLYIYTDRAVLSDFPSVRLRFPLEDGLNTKRIADLYALGLKMLSSKLNRSLPYKEAYHYA